MTNVKGIGKKTIEKNKADILTQDTAPEAAPAPVAAPAPAPVDAPVAPLTK